MTRRPAQWILSLALGLCAPAPAEERTLTAREWVGDLVVAQAIDGRKEMPMDGVLRDQLQAFMERFDRLHAGTTSKQDVEASNKAKEWAKKIGRLPEAEQVKLAGALRRWIALFLRDVSTSMEKPARTMLAKRLETFEKIFNDKAPILTAAFCLDAEVAATPEEAKKLKKELQQIRSGQEEVEEFAAELEKQYVSRIKENPTAADRLYPYGNFLFTMGRLDEADAQLKQVLALDPNYPGAKELRDAIAKANGMDDAVKRARYIQAVIGERRAKAEAEYRAMLKRRHGDGALPSPSAPPASSAPPVSEKVPFLPPKR